LSFVFAPLPTPSAAVHGEAARFPIRRIFCVGRNYEAHAREMGKDPTREAPFFFSKPADAVVDDGAVVPYPPLTKDLQHEAELVVAIGRPGFHVPEESAWNLVWGYAIGNDLTRRDLQLEARDKGRPWDWGKAFDNSAVCGPIHMATQVGQLSSGGIKLSVNGTVRQDANLSDLIWTVPEIVSILSRAVRLLPGDLVYTGTPAGVGALLPGDVCVVEIEGLGALTTTIAETAG